MDKEMYEGMSILTPANAIVDRGCDPNLPPLFKLGS